MLVAGDSRRVLPGEAVAGRNGRREYSASAAGSTPQGVRGPARPGQAGWRREWPAGHRQARTLSAGKPGRPAWALPGSVTTPATDLLGHSDQNGGCSGTPGGALLV